MIIKTPTLGDIVRVAVEYHQPKPPPGYFTEQQKDELIKEALKSKEGKIALGQSLAVPIRRNLDVNKSLYILKPGLQPLDEFEFLEDRVLVIDPIQTGTLPIYDRDGKKHIFNFNKEK